MTLSFLQSETFHLICILWILEEGPARPPANHFPLDLSIFLFHVHTALIEDLLSASGVRLKLLVSLDEWVTDVNVDEEENGHRATIIGGFSFGPGLS